MFNIILHNVQLFKIINKLHHRESYVNIFLCAERSTSVRNILVILYICHPFVISILYLFLCNFSVLQSASLEELLSYQFGIIIIISNAQLLSTYLLSLLQIMMKCRQSSSLRAKPNFQKEFSPPRLSKCTSCSFAFPIRNEVTDKSSSIHLVILRICLKLL